MSMHSSMSDVTLEILKLCARAQLQAQRAIDLRAPQHGPLETSRSNSSSPSVRRSDASTVSGRR